MSLIEKLKVMAAAIEGTSGTAEALGSSDAAFYTLDPQILPAFTFEDLPAAGSMSRHTSKGGIEVATLTFTTLLRQSAAWGPILLPACGFADDVGDLSGTAWSPADDTTKWETLTMGVNKAGKLRRLSGAMGGFEIAFAPGQQTRVSWTFSGALLADTDATQFTPAYTVAAEIAAPKLRSATTTLNGAAVCFGSASLAVNNAVNPLLCQNSGTGILRHWIEDRQIQLTMDPAEQLAAARDDLGLLQSETEHAFALAYANTSLSIPKAQRIGLDPAVRNGLSAPALTLQANMAAAGGDELVLDLDTTD